MGHLFSFLGKMVGLILFVVLFCISPVVQQVFIVTIFISAIVLTLRNSYILHKRYRQGR